MPKRQKPPQGAVGPDEQAEFMVGFNEAIEAEIREGAASGVAERLAINLSPDDYALVQPLIPNLESEIARYRSLAPFAPGGAVDTADNRRKDLTALANALDAVSQRIIGERLVRERIEIGLRDWLALEKRGVDLGDLHARLVAARDAIASYAPTITSRTRGRRPGSLAAELQARTRQVLDAGGILDVLRKRRLLAKVLRCVFEASRAKLPADLCGKPK